ncbi:hypothetical protein PROFUN_10548 [Planoprotostelium fungivorum]|uniref:Uncharacterized protein n=1 Tax=Planoprotostelium fungivorum TaxID=1890364 RepID=A0A2P6N6S2_9EUKA|nr:hypothetical protein PROFUN_10548 [Planoprotostelium fungivorum]
MMYPIQGWFTILLPPHIPSCVHPLLMDDAFIFGVTVTAAEDKWIPTVRQIYSCLASGSSLLSVMPNPTVISHPLNSGIKTRSE